MRRETAPASDSKGHQIILGSFKSISYLTCSTAEVMSDGGGRGEQRYKSENYILFSKIENLSNGDLPIVEIRTSASWYCPFIDKQLLTVEKITVPLPFYTSIEVVKLPRAIMLDTILANFIKVFKHNKLL